MLRVREGFDREQGKAACLKEIVLKSHPELYSIRGAAKIRYDKRRAKFVTYVDCIQKADRERFFIQLETDDPVCREFYGLDPVRYEDLYVGIVSIYDTKPPVRCANKLAMSFGSRASR